MIDPDQQKHGLCAFSPHHSLLVLSISSLQTTLGFPEWLVPRPVTGLSVAKIIVNWIIPIQGQLSLLNEREREKGICQSPIRNMPAAESCSLGLTQGLPAVQLARGLAEFQLHDGDFDLRDWLKRRERYQRWWIIWMQCVYLNYDHSTINMEF